MIEVNEIFGPTIQGEGKRIGTPSVFVRFGKCNMQCAGFGVEYETPNKTKKYGCDSFYASDIAFRDTWKKYFTSKNLIEDVAKYLPSYKVDIVLTGGEPLLYWKNHEFQEFLKYYILNDYNLTIETNGSIEIEFTQNWQKRILFSLGIKLSNSGESLEKRINTKNLENIINFANESYLKFVTDKEFLSLASKEMEAILKKIPSTKVYIMPLGETAEIIDKNSLSVIEFAIKNGFNYSDRLHIRTWNNQRGV